MNNEMQDLKFTTAGDFMRMFIVRKKDGEIIAIASRQEDAIGMADRTAAEIDKTDYIVQESNDSIELREIYRSYYKTRS